MIKKVFKSIFIVSLAIILCCAALFTGVLYKYFTDEHNTEVQNEASYIANGYTIGGIEYLSSVTESNPNTRITLISGNGQVLFDSEADASEMENHIDREEVREALKDGRGESSRYSSTLSEKTYYYALKLSDGNILRVSNVRFSAVTISFSMIQPVVLVIVIAVALSLILASFVSKRIVRPINEINLDNPTENGIDEELTPLIKKIRSQNIKISEQMEELRRSQQEFKMITENMSEGLIILDDKTDVLSYNGSAAEIFDISQKNEKQSAFVLNRSEAFRDAVETALSGRHSEKALSINNRVYNIFSNPVIFDGTPHGAVIVILDITEKEERESLRREFTANVSHELKTPLTSISGFAEIIMNGIAKPEDIPHFAGNIYKEAARLITLVGDIIKISQLDEGITETRREDVDLFELSQSIAQSLLPVAEKRGITISVNGSHETVFGVYDILEEMIYNLCDNAIKYNKDNGKIIITVKDKSVSVRDTGIGIAKAEQDRIFERFYRVDKSHSKEIGGTGLGLSIVKHGAIFHNAKIITESKIDFGTEIRIEFK